MRDCLCQGLQYLRCVFASDKHFEHVIAVEFQLFCAPAFGECSASGALQPDDAKCQAERQQKLKGLQKMLCRAMERTREVACANYDQTLGDNKRPKDPITQKRRQVALT
jgi:hypothetical protein